MVNYHILNDILENVKLFSVEIRFFSKIGFIFSLFTIIHKFTNERS